MVLKKQTYSYLIALVFAVSFLIQFFTLPNADLTWLSFLTAKMQTGAVVYRDFIEPNPPLILWLYNGPILLARYFSLAPVPVLKFFTLALIAVALGFCAFLLRYSSLWQGKEKYSLLIAIAGALLLNVDSYGVFAQREHLLVVLLVPYILLQLPSIARREIPVSVQLAIGGMAALGLCLKPHFFVIFLVLMGCRRLQCGSFRPLFGAAEIMIAAVTLMYSLAVVVFMPQYFQQLQILSGFYGAHGFPKATPSRVAFWFAGPGIVGIVIAWIMGLFHPAKGTAFGQERIYLTWITIAAYLEALLQFKPWVYITYPFIAFSIITLAVVIVLKPVKHFMAIILMGALFYPTIPWNDNGQDRASAYYEKWVPLLDSYRNSKDVYFMALQYIAGEFYRPDPPLQWSSKFNTYYFMLAGTMEASSVNGQPTLKVRPGKELAEQWLLDSIAVDLDAKKPELIVFVRQWYYNESLEDSFDFLSWLKKNPKLTRILNGYVKDKEYRTGYEQYQFFIRKHH